MRLSVLLSP